MSKHLRLSQIPRLTTKARAIGFVAVCLFLFTPVVLGQSAPGFQAPEKPQMHEESIQTKAALGQAPLRKLYDYLKVDPSTTRYLPALDAREKNKKLPGKALRIGAVRSLPDPIKAPFGGAAYRVEEGDVRVFGIVSEGALYTRVQFTRMSLPDCARVFVYSMQNPDEYYGPYEGHGASEDGTFWTPPMKGDGVVIEYFVPKGVENSQVTPFKVSKIAHVYTDPLAPQVGNCHNDVTAPWTDTAKSVGRLDFVTGGGVASCTGTLLADTAMDQMPYLLTANHCFSTQTEAQTLRVYWNYNGPGDTLPSCPANCTDGANLLVSGTSSDFTFVRLTGLVPGGLFFSGWDAATFTGTAAAAGIHHPDSTHKRISFGTAKTGACPAGLQCLFVEWSSGVTEPGSSGSGIWKGLPSDSGGAKLIGTLTGGTSACGAPPSSMIDFYGRFSVTYPQISSFLEGTACVTSLNPTTQNFSAAGGTGSFNVTAPGGCNWTATRSDTFVTITSGSNGTGNGTVNFSVASNSGPQRSATIVVGGQVFNITQSGGGACAPTPITIGQTVNGTLTTNACPLGDGTFYDAYSFNATAGQQVSVLMTSSAFDTYLFLNNPNGSNLTQDDDGGGGTNSRIPPGGGLITLPTTGTYTIWANSFSPGETGPYSLTLSGPIPRTLTVASANPGSGVSITVSPNDNNGLGTGTTQFTRTYNNNTSVSLSAPGTAAGNNFQKWQRDGVDFTTNLVANTLMDTDHTFTAVYVAPTTFVLTVASTNPSSGVNITVSPNDNSGLGNGTTQFTRTYNQNANVNLTAPAAAGGSTFWKWQLNGVDYVQSQFTTITMNANQTATAIYVSPPPTPTPTPVPGVDKQPIAFGRPVSSPGNSGADVFLVNVDGTSAVNLTNAQGDDTRPAWSPDGTRLAYTCRRQPDGSTNGPQRICIRNADGTGFAVLSQTLAEDFGPAWSRDGNQIAFTSFNPGFQTMVTIFNADGTGRRPLNVDLLGAMNPDWSATGQSIAVDYLNSIWVSLVYSYGYQRLTNSTGDSRPRYSPNGSKIVFQSTRDGQSEIYVMNSDGSSQTRLTNNPAADTAPSWSPDGTKILFTSLRDDPLNPALYVMNADGSNPTRLTDGSDGVWRTISTVQFSLSSYMVNEGDGRVNITVNRSGDTSRSAAVGFVTNDAAGSSNCNVFNGTASPRCDYEMTSGTVSFAAGETSKSFSLAIVDDSYAEGTESFTINLNNPSGVLLDTPSTASVTIVDNEATNGPNPINNASFFVRLHYLDFLNREPDADGLAFWTNQITSCGGDAPCVEVKRINVSAAFFLSIEFRQTGYLVYRMYKASYGNLPGAPVPVRLGEFLPDTQEIGQGVIVNQPGWEALLESNKQAFTIKFVQRPRFTSAYATSLTPEQFVDQLFANAGVTPSATDRSAAINEFGSATSTTDIAARARALRRVAENSVLADQELNKAFVLMQYFGYLRRNPYDPPEPTLDFQGYNFWLGKLNQFNGNFVNAEMVKAFIISTEYRQRFGP